MEKKSNSLSRVKRRQQEKVLRFSIRKYSFGAASVAVAALMFLGARVVSADSVTPVEQPHVGASIQGTSSLESQDKEEPASSVKVDTATASQLVAQIKDQLHVKEAANTDLLVTANEELVKAEQTLADSKVSQEEVDALVARLTNVLDQLRAVETPQVKEDKNDKSTQEATPEIKPEVAKPTPEISAKSEETSENTNAEQLEKAKASLKVSIDRLEQAIAQTPENDLTREILEKAIAQVAVAKSAFGGVEVSLRDVEDMNRVIKRNESSVMIARNRLTSGHNDVRNGAAIPVGTTLRADAGATYDNAVGLYFTKEGDGSGYPAGTMLFRDRNQNTADKQRVKDVKDVVKVDVTKNGDTYNWEIEFEANPENHQNAHAWFTIPTGHTLVDDGSASFGSYWGGSGGKRRIETQGRLPRNLYDIFKDQVSSTSKDVNFGTPGGAIEQAWGKAATTDAFWKGADGEIKTFEEIISKPDTLYFNRTGGARTTTEKDVLVSDYLKDWLIRNTQKVYHFDIDYRGRTKDSASNYIFRFKTKAAEGTPLMYAAGMRSYEFSTHRNDMQWYGLPSPKVTGADQTIEKGKEIRLEFTTTDKLAGFSLGDPKLGYNPADSIKLVDSKLELKDQKVEVQKVSDYEHKLIITGRVASEPSDTGYQVKVKSVNNVGQSAEFTSTVKVTQSITPTLELNQDSNTGDVTVTPKKPDGSTYPPKTTVEIPGKDKDHPITVTIREDGKGKVSNSDLPEGNVPGIGKITEPGQPTVEVPDVTTPAKIIPADQVAPTITKLTDNRNAEIDSKNPRKIIVYREEEFSVDVNLTDNSGRLDKIKVHDNAQAVAPSGNFEVTNGGRLELPANGTSINFTDKTSNLGQAGNATDTNPYKVNISGHVGKNQEVKADASKNIWNRYISGYDQGGLTNNDTNNNTANNANIQIEFRKQADKYTPTAVTGSKIDVATDGTISGYNSPETYIANKSELPTTGTTAGTTTTYTWKAGETPTVNNGQVTRTAVVTYPDGSTDEVPVTFTVRDTVAPTITSLTPISNAEIDGTNPHKIIVYREEEFSVDVNLTDNSGRLDKIKVHDNAQAVAPSGNFEVTNGGRLELPANGTSINFTDKTSNLGQAGNATDTNPYKVNISGHVGKNQEVKADASKNIWNRYISGYDQGGLTNNDTNNNTANNANIQIEFRKQADKYTPTAVTGSKIDVATDGTISGYNSPETYIANKSELPTTGTTAGTTTTYTWKAGETPTVNNGQVTRTAVVTYPDGSTDEVPVTFTVRDTVAPTITSLTPISNAEIDGTNPHKIIVYREEEFSVDVNLTDNSGRLDKIKVHDNAQAAAPSGNFEVTNGGRLEVPANGTSINFTDKSNNLGQAGNATDTNPYKVNISGHVGKNQDVKADASKNIWNRYISGYDQEGLTNNNTNNSTANNANIQIEFRKQAEKYTPTAVTGSKIDVATDGTISGYDSPETYIANKSDLPATGTTPGTRTTYAWKDGETPTVNNGQVTRTAVVTYPDGSTDEVPVTFTVRDTVAPTITSLTPIKNAEIDSTNPHKIIVYREEEFSVDVNLTDNSGRLDKIKVHDNAQAVAPSGNFEVTNGGRLEIPANGTSINFTDKTSNLGQAGNATDTNPYKVNISGYVGKGQTINPDASKNIWNRYISGYDQEGLTNNNTNNGSANNANIQIEFRKQADKYTPTATNPTVNLTSNGTVPDLGSPETYIANKSDLPDKGTTPGTTTTYAWKAGETPTVNNGKVTRTVIVTYPDGSTDEVPVTVRVVDPRTDAEKNNPTPQEQTVNVGETPDPKKSIGNVGDLPKGTTVEYKTPVDTTTPGDKKTTAVVTYPDGSKDEVPVTVKVVDPRTDADKNTPTVELEQDPKTGDVTVTPKKPDGSTYKPGTKVEIPGKDGKPIPVTIGEDGKGKVPNSDLPDNKVPGTGKITEPGQPAVEVPVTTPAKVTPETPAQKTPTVELEQDPKTGDVTVTPKKPDGTPYKPGTKVEIPGKDKDHPITVTTDENGKAKVPNADLPEGKVPGTGKITEPGQPAVEVPVTTPAKVTPETPAQKTPTVELEQDPKTGDVTVTPKKPDGTPYKPGTKVEIPGKDKDHPITVTTDENGKAKVPNADLPEGKVPGTGKITEPGQPAVEVPVTTPAKVTPETPAQKTPTVELEQDPKTGDVTVTPKKPDGTPYKPGTKVEIPGKDKDHPITVTTDENGKAKVPNADLPEGKVPGTGKITEPGQPAVEVPVTTPAKVTPETPAQKTPTVELEQDPKTGDVTVTPKKPDGTPYKPGTKVEIPGKDKDHPITVTTDENGKAKVPNADLPEGKVPGTGKITEPGQPAVEVPVTTPAKVTPETPAQKTPTVELEQDPKTGDVTVTPKKPDGTPYKPGTKVEIPGKDKDHPITVTTDENGKAKVPNADLPEGKVPGTGKITEPGQPAVEVPVTTPAKVTPETPAQKTPTVELEQDPKTGDVTVTPKKPDGTPYKPGTKVEIPGKDKDHPITVTTDENGKAKVPNADLPEGKVPGTGKITEPGQPAVEVPVTTPAKVTPETPAQKTPTVELEQDPKTGDVTVTPKKPDGTPYKPGTKVEIPGKDKDHPITVTTDENGKGKVPNADLPEGKVPGTGKITEPGKPAVEVPVETPAKVTPETPAQKTPTVELEQDPKTGDVTVTPKKPDGTPYKPGTKVEIPGKDKDHPITVTTDENGKGKVPNADLPEGKVPGTGKITEPGKPAVEVPVETPAKVTPETPAQKTPTVELEQDPKTGDVTVTPKKPDGTPYKPGTKVEIPGKDKDHPITVTTDENGKGKVPNADLPEGKVPGTGKITEPGKPAVEVPVETPAKVTPETPAQKTPTVELEQDPKTGDVTVTPKQPDGSTYPPGTKVEIPGKDKDHPITVTTDENGKGKVPNADLPEGKVPGTGKITEPGKPAVEVPVETPAKVTPETPAQKTPTVELEQDPKTGDVTVTPKQPDGSTYPPGTKVEIPGKDKDHPITVTTDENGKGKVPNADLPEGKVPGTGKITEPSKPAVEVPVETPAKVTPETPAQKTPTVELEQDPKTGDVTVTPKQPDGSTYPPGTKVEIPGKDKDHPITVTTDENGKAKVPNADLPEGKVPGTGKITEPGKPAVEVPVETPAKVTPETPAQKTPTVELEQDPKTGDVTVTPKKPDGTPYKPGTKVEIPGKDKDHPITVTTDENGKAKVPNADLPEGKVPGTGKITEPGKPAVEVPVETPAKVTPETPAQKTPTVELEQDPKTGDVTVTPKQPDGSTYPPGTKVEIPGKDKDHPITVTTDENGKGKVPNADLPEGKVPGTGKITEPGKPAVEVPVETPAKVTPETPAQKTPTVELEQDPKTGDVTVTPKQPDGSTYPPGTKVEIPGKDKDHPITVTTDENGKGKVPNADLPEGKVPGTGKITEPGKPAVEVPVETPAKVTPETPAQKTPTVELEQDPKTGDVTVTPKKPDGTPYKPGTKVEIPGKDKDHPITVTTDENGKAKVPNADLPEGKVPGTGKITEPGKPAVEVPVETPAKVTPETPAQKTPTVELEQDPKTGDVTVTPKKPDGTPYKPGTKVEIPGKDKDHPITVTTDENGKAKVPNADLPEGKVPGTGKITEPGKPAVEVPVETPAKVTPETPAQKTPTVELEQDPKTGDVTVTPKKPDGTPYKPGTKVEIPGKDKDHPITVTTDENGKAKVPNADLPEGKVPGTGKITEPGKPAVEVPVETPAKVTPETPAQKTPTVELEQDPKTGDVTVTPKKPDGTPYKPGTKVEIPGKDKDHPITVTTDENGKAKVPNADLPEGKVPGTGKITEPGKPAVEVPVETPAKVTPNTPRTEKPGKIEITRKPNGDAIVTPKKPDGSTYPSGSKVVIPGENGTPITVTIGDNGSGEVPNDKLPKKDVPGTGTVTEPNKKPSQPVDVTTPGKVTPATPTDTIPVAPVTPDTPVKPDTNGGSGQDTPTPTTPNAVTPNADQVDTKTTNDNGAKSNDSQNVLPNTGTESNATLASLGLLGILGGLGLALGKKKED